MAVNAVDKMAGEALVSEAMPLDYFQLLKPRVMSLVVFTALVGLVVAPGNISPAIAFIAILCIAVGAGASGALNMWVDADIDAVMSRTRNRPIPRGVVPRHEALAFGLSMAFLSVFTMAFMVNYLAAALLAFTIFFYVVIYSMWLKRSTPQNIVIGGAAGAFPPMIGWASVTGNISVESTVLFLIIFVWTPPHFWALALFKSADYARARVPMLPVVNGLRSTQNHILFYSLLLAPIGMAPWFMGFCGPLYGLLSAVLGAIFIFSAWRVWQMKADDTAMKPAKQMFAFSILYLFTLFAAILLQTLITNRFA